MERFRPHQKQCRQNGGGTVLFNYIALDRSEFLDQLKTALSQLIRLESTFQKPLDGQSPPLLFLYLMIYSRASRKFPPKSLDQQFQWEGVCVHTALKEVRAQTQCRDAGRALWSPVAVDSKEQAK
uniref:(California timema) hypothetical protein n=1 Tax=Timema californicum TaxID=61474 RepID=A0A7R9J4G3_TIMCA|nr:unnamed protein product [Timema californicum]